MCNIIKIFFNFFISLFFSIISCETKISKILRIPDKSKLYDCDFPDCLKFFETNDKLGYHKYSVHNIQVDAATIMKYNIMMHGMSGMVQQNYSNNQNMMNNNLQNQNINNMNQNPNINISNNQNNNFIGMDSGQ